MQLINKGEFSKEKKGERDFFPEDTFSGTISIWQIVTYTKLKQKPETRRK